MLIGMQKIQFEIKNLPRFLPHLLLSGRYGSGKTAMSEEIAKQRGKKLIILTGHTSTKQDVINVLLNLKGGELILLDECLTKGTLIVKKDGGVESIENYTKGNLFLGKSIKEFIPRTTKKILKITTSLGMIETTTNHTHLGARNYYQKEIEEIKAKDLKKGNYLITSKYIPHRTKTKWTSKDLKFVALTIADGCITPNKACLQFSFGKEERYLKAKKIIEGINFKYKPTSISYRKNRDYIIRLYGSTFINYIVTTFNIPIGNTKKHNTTISNEIFYAPKKSILAFIITILYFEGQKTKSNTFFSMASRDFIFRFQLLLKKFGIASSVMEINTSSRRERNLTPQFRLCVSTKKRTAFKYKKAPIVLTKIKKIETVIKTQIVYDYATTTSIFVANGFITHNCHRLSARVEELLYLPMEKFILPIPNSKGTSTVINLPQFTLIGTTTKTSDISKPMLSRFLLHFIVPDYSLKDLANIIKYKHRLPISDCVYIAKHTLTPREAINLAFRVKSLPMTTKEAMLFMGYKFGLSKYEREYLKLLKQRKRLSLNSFRFIFQLDKSEVMKIEDKLINLGHIEIKSNGRFLTDKGGDFIKKLED